MKVILSVTSADCSGRGGIQADIKTIAAHNNYAATCITKVVAKEGNTVLNSSDITAENLKLQMKAVFDDMKVNAVKLGVFASPEQCKSALEIIEAKKVKNIVLGIENNSILMDKKTMEYIKDNVISKTDLLVINAEDCKNFLGIESKGNDNIKEIFKLLISKGAKSILIRNCQNGGEITDKLYHNGAVYKFQNDRYMYDNFDTICSTLTAAIASNMSQDMSIIKSIKLANEYAKGVLDHSLIVGRGKEVMSHFYNFSEENCY